MIRLGSAGTTDGDAWRRIGECARSWVRLAYREARTFGCDRQQARQIAATAYYAAQIAWYQGAQ